MTSDATDDLEVLDRETCLQLLSTVEIGRLAWTDDGTRVTVLPVNFVVDGDRVVLRSRTGSTLAAAEHHRVMSFEADDLEPALHTGWSVLVSGPAGVVTDPAEGARYAERIHPWAAGEAHDTVVLHIQDVSGRRLRLKHGGSRVVHLDEQGRLS